MDSRVSSTVEFLESHSSASFTVRELARRVHLAESRLQHLFKAELSVSIRTFVKSQRLRNAAELIAGTHRRISEICFLVGFTDPSNFDHAFKNEFAVSPREYRRMLQGRAKQHCCDETSTAASEEPHALAGST